MSTWSGVWRYCSPQARHRLSRGSVEGNQGDIIFFMLNTSFLFNIMKKNLIHSEGINLVLHASVQCLRLCMRRSSPPEEVLLHLGGGGGGGTHLVVGYVVMKPILSIKPLAFIDSFFYIIVFFIT